VIPATRQPTPSAWRRRAADDAIMDAAIGAPATDLRACFTMSRAIHFQVEIQGRFSAQRKD
jgi:hypothetical protein